MFSALTYIIGPGNCRISDILTEVLCLFARYLKPLPLELHTFGPTILLQIHLNQFSSIYSTLLGMNLENVSKELTNTNQLETSATDTNYGNK